MTHWGWGVVVAPKKKNTYDDALNCEVGRPILSVIGGLMCMEHGWNNDRRQQNYSEKPLSHYHFDTNLTCTDLGLNPDLFHDKPRTCRPEPRASLMNVSGDNSVV